MRRATLSGLAAAALLLAVAPAATGDVPQADYFTCPAGQTPTTVPVAPQASPGPTRPAGTMVTVATSQPWNGFYQQAEVRIGTQLFDMVLDTGSSWVVLNASAVADNAEIVPTGRTAAVTYGGGATCAAGPVVTAPVSIGGLAPRPLTFLLAESGNFPFLGILGINTWQPPASALDVPLPALGIDRYEITLPVTGDPQAHGTWVVNGQPAIDAADPRRVATFDNPALAGGNRVFLPGALTTSTSASGAFMLDIGTPQNLITVFPGPATQLGYDFAAATWAQPAVPVQVTADPSDGPAFDLQPSVAPITTGDLLTLTPQQVAEPTSGVTGLAGTAAIIGADYVRPWVMGVQFTERRGVVRLLARDREPAQLQDCGSSLPPARIARAGLTRLVPAGCRVNGNAVTVRVAVRVTGPGAGSCTAKRCPSQPYRLATRADGSVWLRTFGFRMRASVTWDAPVYLSHDRFHVARSYRIGT